MTDKPLAGKVAIVTGASRGIGYSIARILASAGADLALAARSQPDLDEAQASIVADYGVRALAIPTDLKREEEVVVLVERSVDALGQLDILVNNAGVGVFGPLVEATVEDWDHVMAVNARGLFLMCRQAIPHLRRRRQSWIININSSVGVRGYANQSLYSASKHAVMGLSKALAKEVQADGIRVHVICSGGVDTDMIRQARPDLDPSVLMQPEDISDLVLFLVTRRGNAMIDQIDLRRYAATPFP